MTRLRTLACCLLAAIVGATASHRLASADGDAGAAPPLEEPAPRTPPAHLEGWPADSRSERPKPEAWADAPDVPLTRVDGDCRAKRIREWLRLTCRPQSKWDEVMSVRVLGGSDEGVEISDADKPAKDDETGQGVHIVLPVRPGDRRVFQLAEAQFAFKAYTPDEVLFMAISELWLPGAPGPTIVVN